MSDAVDKRLVDLVDMALGEGRDVGHTLLEDAGAEGDLLTLASAGINLALGKAREALLAAFAGSGRVDVDGDVPVDVTVRD